MASAVYPKFVEALLSKEVDVPNDTIVAYLVDTADYTYNAAHEVLTDLTAAGREEVSGAISGKVVTSGILDLADVTWTAAAGDGIEAIVLYDSTADRLMIYVDLGGTTLLNGGNIACTWAGTPNYVCNFVGS